MSEHRETAAAHRIARATGSNILKAATPSAWVEAAIADLPTLLAEWESLVVAHSCSGRASFDARLVAAMQTHGVIRILTLNGADFARFPGIAVLDPAAVAVSAWPPPSTKP
jgi:predicted nucleic acid-binding protein